MLIIQFTYLLILLNHTAPIVSTDEDGVEVRAVATQRAKDAYFLDVFKKHEELIVKAPENDEVAERVNKERLEGGAESEKLRGKVLRAWSVMVICII